jgi:AraC-like DNA-binding protein
MQIKEGVMMQTLLLFEVLGRNDSIGCVEKILNPHLKKAVIYIESNFHNAIELKDVTRAVALSHSSLTQLFKKELGMTPIKYVWHYRIVVAEKLFPLNSITASASDSDITVIETEEFFIDGTIKREDM